MSREPQVDAFGGITGRVLKEAMSGSSLLTGFVLLMCLGWLGLIMKQFESVRAFTVLLQLTMIMVMARFALNGFAGEWGGTLFSSRGGSWFEATKVGARFITLSSAWILPILLMGWRPEEVGTALGDVMMGAGGGKMLILSAATGTFMALTPPAFLIVSVGADSFSPVFQPAHWRRLFRGRLGELFLIYAVYIGALAMTVIIILPLFTSIAIQNPDFASLIGLFILAFGTGLAVNLLGRLCGFFAATPHGSKEQITGGDIAPRPVDNADTAEMTLPPQTEVSAAIDAIGPVTTAEPKTETPAAPHLKRGVPRLQNKAPLWEARTRVDELSDRFNEAPENTIDALFELKETYSPHPLVLHELCACLYKVDRVDESWNIAREALPLCLNRGALRLAANIYALHLSQVGDLELPRDTVLAIADNLRQNQNLAASKTAYLSVLEKDFAEHRAIKGLLQVADSHFSESNYQSARGIYLALLDHCSDSPLAVHMHEGLAEAERRLAKAA